MLIAIISDIHDNTVNLQKVLNYCVQEKVEKIICCGDLGSNETLDFLCNNFSGEIFYALGNMETGRLDVSALKNSTHNNDNSIHYKNATIFEKFGETKIDKKAVAFIHFPREAKALAETGKYDFVFHGHTHKPWVSSAKATDDQRPTGYTILNPGTVTGDFYPPTFAVWNTETDKFELIRIHNLK